MSVFWTALFACGWVLASVAFFYGRSKGLMAMVDLIWTSGLGLSVLAYQVFLGPGSTASWIVTSILLLWSLRLSLHLLRDRILPGHEDPRYVNLALYWGDRADRNFLYLFLVQIPFVALFVLPVTVALDAAAAGWSWFQWLGVPVALLAIAGEFAADRQLARFRSRPGNEGGVCREGLWRYSRHPNYFFEWLHWWAYVAFSLGTERWWLSLSGPVAMYIFLRFLTGVPPAERSSVKRRGDAYRDYQRSTNAFFPWKPHVRKS